MFADMELCLTKRDGVREHALDISAGAGAKQYCQIVDLGQVQADLAAGSGQAVRIHSVITEAAVGGVATINLLTSDNADMSSATTLKTFTFATDAVGDNPMADVAFTNESMKRYLQLDWTNISDLASAGKIFSAVVVDDAVSLEELGI